MSCGGRLASLLTMCRLLLIFAILSGLLIGPCAFACGLTAINSQVSGEISCNSADASGGPCCPVAPEPLCQCDDADASALLSNMAVLPLSAASQELLVHLVAPPTWRCQGYATVAARAPPGLKALRSVVLLI